MFMEIKELVMHPAQLEKVELIKVNCEKESTYNEENNKLDISLELGAEIIDANNGASIINVNIKGEGFFINIVERGQFSFDNIGENNIPRFLEVQGVKILWSYVREVIYDLSGKMLRKPILIPTIDVLHTLENVEKER